jgi:hypothetical protein
MLHFNQIINHSIKRLRIYNMSKITPLLILISIISMLQWACDDGSTDDGGESTAGMMQEEDRGSSNFKFDQMMDNSDAQVREDQMLNDMLVENDMDADLSCQSCSSDDECGDADCVSFGPNSESQCFYHCIEGECEQGYSCLFLDEVTEVCIPEEGECEYCYDLDGDGAGEGDGCSNPRRDCNDNNENIYPMAVDGCDGVDNDCDGNNDEDYMPESCGSEFCLAYSTCVEGMEVACMSPVITDQDLCDGIDNDCDGSMDEDYVVTTCGEGLCVADSSCIEGQEVCEAGIAEMIDDLTCDGIDDDCDGNLDEDFFESCGFGRCISQALCVEGASSCQSIAPDPAELDASCDGIDDDCDDMIDEGFVDTCGLGACERPAQCQNAMVACEPGAPNPEGDILCDGVDEDCDGEIDEDCDRNRLTVSYNAASSTAEILALDIYYEHSYSSFVPTYNPLLYRPTTMNLAVIYPVGMSPVIPLNEASTYDRGSSLVDAFKNVDVRNDANNRRIQYLVLTIVGEGASTVISPIDPANNRDGKILTIYFERNGVNAPWSFEWDLDRTYIAPEEALEIFEISQLEPMSP